VFIRLFYADPVDEEPVESWEMVGKPYPCSAAEMTVVPERLSLLRRGVRWLADKTRSTRTRIAAGLTTVVVVIGGFLGLNGGDETPPPSPTPTVATATATATPTEVAGGLQQVQPQTLVIPVAGASTSLWDGFFNGELRPADSGASFTGEQAAWVNSFEAAMSAISPAPTDSSFPSDVVPAQMPGRAETALGALGGSHMELGDDARMRLFFNTVFPCGEGDVGFTFCPTPLGSSPGGEHLVIMARFDAPLSVAVDDGQSQYQYGFVFDSDGVAENNYQASASFPNDFFDGTDRWYVVSYGASSGWTMQVSQVTSGAPAVVPSAARIVLVDELMVLIVPASEFSIAEPPYRSTAFWHTGDFGRNPPHTWSGDVEPPVAEGLSTEYFSDTLTIER
jgi:hypothetical protein